MSSRLLNRDGTKILSSSDSRGATMGSRRVLAIFLFLVFLAFAVGGQAQTAAPSTPQSTGSQASPNASRATAVAPAGSAAAHTTAALAPSLSAFDRFLASLEQVLKVLAYLVGGLWVYFNYFKGRTHRPRVELKVTCTPINATTPILLRVMAQAKNAGLSKVEITDEGTAIVVYGYKLHSGRWNTLQAHPILTNDHTWIEPGVTIQDEILVRVDDSYAAFRIELRLNAKSKVTWVTSTITGPNERNDRDSTAATTASSAAATRDAAGSEANAADRRAEETDAAAATATGQAVAR